MYSVTSVLAGLDFGAARWGIGRDIEEMRADAFGWFLMGVVFGLPIASLLVLSLRCMLALVPLAISAFVFGLWFLYYATDWFSNPGQGVWLPVFLLVLFGWSLLVAAVFRPWKRGPFPELLNVRALFVARPTDHEGAIH